MTEPNTKAAVLKKLKSILQNAPTTEKAKKAVADVGAATLKVLQGIKKKVEPDLLATYQRELKLRLEDAAFLSDNAASAINFIKLIIEDDESFKAAQKELTTAQEVQTENRTSLADSIVNGRKVEELSKAEVARGEKSEAVAHRQWDVIIERLDVFEKMVGVHLKRCRDGLKAAKAAVEERDGKELQRQQGIIRGSAIALTLDVTTEPIANFDKKYDVPSFSKEFRDEVTADKKKVDQSKKARLTAASEADGILTQVDTLKVGAVDAVKVTAKLGFKASFNSRVEKALKLDEAKLAKELEAIGKESGVKGAGKDFVAKLKKEGMYP